MDYFVLKPDFTLLGRYIPFNKSEEELKEATQRAAEEGFIMTPLYYGTAEQIQRIEAGVRSILAKFSLSDHFDNFLYLCLSQLDVIEHTLIQIDNDWIYKKRAKELAQLLLLVENTTSRQYHSISFKSNTETVKISDKDLAAWIGEAIKTAFKSGTFPFSFLGLEDMRMRSTGELTKVANARVRRPSGKPTKIQLAQFCMLLKPYLQVETNLTNDEVQFTDAELNFYFELLVLFDLLKSDDFGSEPKDYIGSMLRNNLQQPLY